MATDSNQNGITIQADGVTVDLNGFSLVGTGTPGNGNGIRVSGVRGDIVILNGKVLSWSANGINTAGMVRGRIEGMESSLNGLTGIVVGPSNVLLGNVAMENGEAGITVGGAPPYTGGRVIGSHVAMNGSGGIGVTLDFVVIEGNFVSQNGAIGIFTSTADYGTIEENRVFGTQILDGIVTGDNVVIRNIVAANRTGIVTPPAATNARVGPFVSATDLPTANPFANVVYDNPAPP
jgi:parallel beta-helix repeat protein